MCFGEALLYYVLCALSIKLKKPILVLIFALSFIASLFMGYLSSKDFSLAIFNWIAQSVNIVVQGLFLTGVWRLRKAGLANLSLNHEA